MEEVLQLPGPGAYEVLESALREHQGPWAKDQVVAVWASVVGGGASTLHGLEAAAGTMPEGTFVQTAQRVFAWALELQSCGEAAGVKRLAAGVAGSVAVPRRVVLRILAACVLDLVPELSFRRVLVGEDPVSVARVRCMLSYFSRFSRPAGADAAVGEDSALDGNVVIHRRSGFTLPDMDTCMATIPATTFDSSRRIEESTASAHIDFANARLHIGRVIPSATQEEVLFSIRPELFVGMLVAGQDMRGDEAIVMQGARQFSDYSGYLSTFRFARDVEPTLCPAPDVVAIDAVVAVGANQFTREAIVRDCHKAWLGFVPVEDATAASSASTSGIAPRNGRVSTGNWGCGAFGGDVALKFTQQALAAAAAGVALEYSTFKNPTLEGRLRRIAQQLEGRPVHEVFHILCAYRNLRGGPRNCTTVEDLAFRLGGDKRLTAAESYTKALACEEAGDFQEARAAYSKAFRLWPSLDSPVVDQGLPGAVVDEARAAGLGHLVSALQSAMAPYMSGDFQEMEKLASDIPTTSFEEYLNSALAAAARGEGAVDEPQPQDAEGAKAEAEAADSAAAAGATGRGTTHGPPTPADAENGGCALT
mmetsp:Transcript_26899/g.78320  ORF Transcript_26899/g.78320 Transcript_26899/m.78320 type:complete len:592 (-) Transcript_26899:126-1901(-)